MRSPKKVKMNESRITLVVFGAIDDDRDRSINRSIAMERQNCIMRYYHVYNSWNIIKYLLLKFLFPLHGH